MKKFISIFLAALMLIPALATASSAVESSLPFTDVSKEDWYYDSVYRCYYSSIIHGMTRNRFEPNTELTRAQFAQMLLGYHKGVVRVSDSWYKDLETKFQDVPENSWYKDAVVWATEIGAVSGMSETEFRPHDIITREQMIRIFYHYIKYLKLEMTYTNDLSGFSDISEISDWALEEMKWAIGSNIITGMGDGTLAPKGITTRAQACTIFTKLSEYYTYDGPVDQTGAYAALKEYIEKNGTSKPDSNNSPNTENDLVYEITIDGKTYTALYDYRSDGDNSLIFTYSYEVEEGKTAVGHINIDSICSQHDADFSYTDTDNNDSLVGWIVLLTAEGMKSPAFFTCQIDYDVAEKMAIDTVNETVRFVEGILLECGYTYGDLFR